jgi:carbonic anhydrase
VIQFAVDILRVRHIIVCGHYGCSGVQRALHRENVGLADNWLRHVEDVYEKHAKLLTAITDEKARYARLCELNVLEQVVNVSRTTVVRDAWARGQQIAVHGWIYGVEDGRMRELGLEIGSDREIIPNFLAALDASTA